LLAEIEFKSTVRNTQPSLGRTSLQDFTPLSVQTIEGQSIGRAAIQGMGWARLFVRKNRMEKKK
jgi:hypothetical protein